MAGDDEGIDYIILTSCALSLIGSVILMLTCLAKQNRKKHARILLFWLSLSDMMTAIAYIFSITFSSTLFCDVTALVSIFFPVASFMWTDIVAFYLYTIVIHNQFRSSKKWNQTMFYYHCFAWGIPLIIVLTVALTDHEGQPYLDDDAANTKWCWIKGNGRTDQFVWELIGGKIVEWLSCLIISVLYILIMRKLYHMNQNRSRTTTQSNTQTIESELNSPIHNAGCESKLDMDLERFGASNDLMGNDHHSSSSYMYQTSDIGTSHSKISGVSAKHLLEAHNRQGLDCDEDAVDSASESSGGSLTDYPDSDVSIWEDSIVSVSTTRISLDSKGTYGDHGVQSNEFNPNNMNSNQFFNRFFLQMTVVPFVFFFVRLWGSLRIIILYENPNANVTLLTYMQAICDPAQGFWNFLLFVMTSQGERTKMWGYLHDGFLYARNKVFRKYLDGCLNIFQTHSRSDVDEENGCINASSGVSSSIASDYVKEQGAHSNISTQVWGGHDNAMATSQQNQFIVHSSNTLHVRECEESSSQQLPIFHSKRETIAQDSLSGSLQRPLL